MDVMDIQVQMQVQVSGHFAGSGTYRVCFLLELLLCFATPRCNIAFSSSFRTSEITECQSQRYLSTVSRVCCLMYNWSARLLSIAACSNMITGLNTVKLGDFQCRLE